MKNFYHRSLSVVEKGEDMINFIRPKIILSFQVKNLSNILIHEEGSLTDDDDHDDSDFDELSSDNDELFAAPRSNLNYDPDEEKFVNVNDPWILFWIFKYQERFRLSNVTINSLIGFFSLVL